MRKVASMGVPTWRGADEAKKKPPRETFKASVKCSVLSEATPRARKRRGVRRLRRASCRRSVTFILASPRKEGSGADSRESDGGYLQRNRVSRAVKYQSWHGQEQSLLYKWKRHLISHADLDGINVPSFLFNENEENAKRYEPTTVY